MRRWIIASGRNYRSKEYIALRNRTMARDNYECLQCKKKGKDSKGQQLEVHHIIPWSQSEELRFNLQNTICLCKLCHAACSNGKEAQYADYFKQLVREQEQANKETGRFKPKKKNPRIRY